MQFSWFLGKIIYHTGQRLSDWGPDAYFSGSLRGGDFISSEELMEGGKKGLVL